MILAEDDDVAWYLAADTAEAATMLSQVPGRCADKLHLVAVFHLPSFEGGFLGTDAA